MFEQRKNSSTISTIVVPSSQAQSSTSQNSSFKDDYSEQSSVTSLSQTLRLHDQNTCKKCHHHYSASFIDSLKYFSKSVTRKIKQSFALSDKTGGARNQYNSEREIQKPNDSSIGTPKIATDEEKSGYFQITPAEKTKNSPQGRIVAVLMIIFGTLMALVFILVGMGKAVDPRKASLTNTVKEISMTSDAYMTTTGLAQIPTESISANPIPTSTFDKITKLIIVEDSFITSKIITEATLAMTILATPI